MSDNSLDTRPALGRRLLSAPRFWLAVEIIALAVILQAGNRFDLVEFPDSPTYTTMVGSPLGHAMKSPRTLGYPLILTVVHWFSPDYRWLPWVHFLAFCGMVLVVDAALRRCGMPAWLACAAGTGLLWSCLLMRDLVGSLLTDLPGVTAAISATAFLLMVVATPNKIWPWVALTLSVALAYHIRPAYLFLVGFVPVTGLLLRHVRAAHGEPVWQWFKFAGVLVGVMVLPLLAYCGLRWAMIGQFGLVNFGGFNTIGIAVEFLHRDTIERDVPEHLRPLALEILERRESVPRPRAYTQGVSRVRYTDFLDSYDANVWQSGIPVMSRHYNDGPTINSVCLELSRPVLWAHKWDYAKLMALNAFCSLENTCQWYTGKWWLPPRFRETVKFLFFGALGILAFRLAMRRRWPVLRTVPSWLGDGGMTWAFLLTTALFVAGNMILVVAVQAPVPRYVFPAVAILPAGVFLWMAREWIWAASLARVAIRPASHLLSVFGEAGHSPAAAMSRDSEILQLEQRSRTNIARGTDPGQQSNPEHGKMSNESREGWRTLAWRVLSTPRFWFGVEVAVLAAVLYCGDRFELVVFPDSPTYTDMIGQPLADAMKSRRTLGYPLILGVVQEFSPDYGAVPWLQFLAYCGAVLAMDAALRRWGATPWKALVADTGLLWSCILNRDMVGALLTDMPGMTTALAATAFVLMVVATPNRIWPWIAMTFSVALAYHIRPSSLFLVGFAPVIGLVLQRVRAVIGASVWPWPKFAGAIAAATIIPLLAYFGLRWAMVGEFALVSFGGYNSVGMAVELLTPETIERDVPEHLRPLAREILARREAVPRPRAYAQGVRRSQYRYFIDSYHANVELAAVPAIKDYYNCPEDYFQVNRVCAELLRPVLWANKLNYAKMMVLSFTQSLGCAFQWYTGKWWLPSWFRGNVRFFLFGAMGIFVVRLWVQRRWPSLRALPPWSTDRGLTAAFLATASLFVVGSMALLVASSAAIPRYVFATVAIMPGALLLWVVGEWRWAAALAGVGFARGRQRLVAIHDELVTLRKRVEMLEAENAALKSGKQVVLSGGETFQQETARQRSAA